MLALFQYDFMVRALLAGLVVGCVCPAVGVFLVLRHYSFLAETLAHVSLAGIAVGLLLGVFPFLATFLTALLAAVVVEALRLHKKLYNDALLALVMSGGLALAVVLFSYARNFNVDVMSYLFGSILTVTPLDLWLIIIVGVLVFLTVAFFYKELYFISFDEECARVAGLSVHKINFIFILMVASTVSIAVRVAGALLVGALMVIPVIIALLISRSFYQTFWLSIVTGIFVTLTGLVSSFYLGTASGGTIVLFAVFLFGIVLAGVKIKEFFPLQRRTQISSTSSEKSREHSEILVEREI